MRCFPAGNDDRRNLWTNHPDACGSGRECGGLCGVPGLSLDGASLSTEGWIISTLLNMLMTNGKRDDAICGWNPNGRGGHWSESYITSGPAVVGSQVSYIEPSGRVQDQQALLTAHVQQIASRLPARGVSTGVEVETEYAGNGRFRVNITVQGSRGNPSRVGVTAERMENGWVWNNV